MKVKIGDKIYDAVDQPVMVILSDQDKENIKSMPGHNHKYAGFPDGWGDKDKMIDWMKGVDRGRNR